MEPELTSSEKGGNSAIVTSASGRVVARMDSNGIRIFKDAEDVTTDVFPGLVFVEMTVPNVIKAIEFVDIEGEK